MTYDETVAQSLTIRGAIQAARETDVAARAEYDAAVGELLDAMHALREAEHTSQRVPCQQVVNMTKDRVRGSEQAVRSLRAKLGMG